MSPFVSEEVDARALNRHLGRERLVAQMPRNETQVTVNELFGDVEPVSVAGILQACPFPSLSNTVRAYKRVVGSAGEGSDWPKRRGREPSLTADGRSYMSDHENEKQWEAMDAFQQAVDRLLFARSPSALIAAYLNCLERLDQVPEDLRQHFELDQFLLDIAVGLTRGLRAA